MEKELKQYIDWWNQIEGIKPKNEMCFIGLFEKFMDSLSDCRDISFDGEGSYFGRQVTIIKDQVYRGGNKYGFEIAYCSDKISVYRANHEGYWTPEYISLNREDSGFGNIQRILARTLIRLFDLTELIKI